MRVFTRLLIVGTAGLLVGAEGGAMAQVAPAPSQMAPAPSQMAPAPAQATPPPAQAAQPPTQEAAPGNEQTVEPMGLVELVGSALSKVCLSDDQRAAVEQVGQSIADGEKKVADARHDLVMTLADQIETDQIDEKAIDAKIDALVAARKASSPSLRKAFEDLHGILDKSERGAFADALESRMNELRDAKGWFEAFSGDLGLTDEQKKEVLDSLAVIGPELKDERVTAENLIGAFRADGPFSVEAIAPSAQLEERTRVKAEGMVCVAKSLAEILTPQQRKVFAQKLHGKVAAAGNQSEPVGQTTQGFFTGGGFRAGAFNAWGGSYASRTMSMRSLYAAGYPLVGGYSFGVW